MSDAYVYSVDLNWTAGRSGVLAAKDSPALEFSAPPEFAGEPGKWSPESLLVAALGSCFTATFMAVAEFQKLRVLEFRMAAFGRMEKIPGQGYRFTEFTLTPEIRVEPEDVERAMKVVEKAHKGCFVSNSLTAKVQVEPRILAAVAELV
jgi:organic hydroperoxide reductase OsmC/OhrA